MENIDREILNRASAGDIQAFEFVYKASSSFVYNVAYRVVGNREDAFEVAQEVFMIIHDKLKSFRFESSFKTWVYRITANTAINYAKKTVRSKTVSFEDFLIEPAVNSQAVDRLQEQDNQQLLGAFLNELNPEQRACVVLREIEGLSYQQVAASLNININTVRTRLKRAREKLLNLRKSIRSMNDEKLRVF